jgi:hypothetical protein
MQKLLITAGLAAAAALAATSGTFAQTYIYGAPYGYAVAPYGYGYYDYAPGFAGSYFDSGYYRGPYYESERGGPGPRVGSGQGMGAGSQR